MARFRLSLTCARHDLQRRCLALVLGPERNQLSVDRKRATPKTVPSTVSRLCEPPVCGIDGQQLSAAGNYHVTVG